MSEIRNFILSLQSPVVFHGKIAKWDMLKWDEEKWCSLFGDKPLPFRCGLKICTPEPQWERTCKTEYMPLSEFFKNAGESSRTSWKYFDYKYLSEWLKESENFKSLSWANLGFPEISKDDCTLWIGSSGAHTPCHMDSYGCNLVAQIYGHKQWILFPPSESSKLKMTRVPYEESSVYSALNFNTPMDDICKHSFSNVHIITLSPGDVLFVPHHWWHYVENLDTAIAINTWLPLPNDDDSRMDEVLVRFLILQTSLALSPAELSEILNPNEDDLSNTKLYTTINQMKICIQNILENTNLSKGSAEGSVSKESDCKESFNTLETITDDTNKDVYQDNKKRKLLSKASQILPNSSKMIQEELKDFKIVTSSEVFDLKKVLEAKCKCGSKEEHKQRMKSNQNSDDTMVLLRALLNSFCHPDVLKTVKTLLLKQASNKRI